ncbi:hypothetical protein E8E13_000369 [Curvularia kusanoi]|uniref:Uncharacterized protein n=1 Tax=Curvularia kusanoi TaxID=90978 RepID=A0A9P4W8U7_CURKU|nr:hypothetical protein E8E13_000369 [Curvularia kusanoi]
MSTKPPSSSTPTATTATKQPRSRKAANPNTAPSTAGRAGSAGGVVLEKGEAAVAPKKEAPQKLAVSSAIKTTKAAPPSESKDAPTQQKRKPRKLNKEPTTTTTPAAGTKDGSSTEAAELEALKSRVRGLEAKVEELYKSSGVGGGQTATGVAPRSPRRRGKGRKSSSATTTATLGTLASARDREAQIVELNNDDDDEDADEELVRLEDELETARQDLALYRPGSASASSGQQRPRTRRSGPSEEAEDVEEIPRDRPAAAESRPGGGLDRQVTLSGSYRIPLPPTLNPEDVKTIQSGVTAAQNVARSFLDQRRANAANVRGAAAQGDATGTASAAAGKREGKAKASSAREAGGVADAGGKQSWGEWIGGYSMAISRAVKSIEHEAAMEAQRAGQAAGGKREKAGASAGARRKRPGPKTTLSGEQIEGLMG